MTKLEEYTYGAHIYMRMRLDNGRIEEIDVFLRKDGEYYFTSADYGMSLYKDKELEERKTSREEIIKAFKKLY